MTPIALPLYKVEFYDDDSLLAVALVDEPAIESNWEKFAADKTKAGLVPIPPPAVPPAPIPAVAPVATKETVMLSFSARADSTRPDLQLLVGPALIPNKPIPRAGRNGGPDYCIVWDQAAVLAGRASFLKNKDLQSFNIGHDPEKQIKCTLQDEFISGPKGIAQLLGIDVPPGSWIIALHVQDKAVWDSYVTTGAVLGFSIEATAHFVPTGDVVHFSDESAAVGVSEPAVVIPPSPLPANAIELARAYMEAAKVHQLKATAKDVVAIAEASARKQMAAMLEAIAHRRKIGRKLSAALEAHYTQLMTLRDALPYFLSNKSDIQHQLDAIQ